MHRSEYLINFADLRFVLQVDGSIEVWHLFNDALADQISLTRMEALTQL